MRLINVVLSIVFIVLLVSGCQGVQNGSQPYNQGGGQLPQGSSNQPQTTNISTGNLNTSLPSDVLEEVAYYGGLGGGGQGCSNSYGTPTFVSGINDVQAQLLDQIEVEICGVQTPGENINISVQLPDNSSRSFTAHVESDGSVYFEYDSRLGDPTGTYHFSFDGSNWSLNKDIVINDISSPSLFKDGSQLILAKFRPNENVRLFLYKSNGSNAKFIGWQSVQVDSNGQLIVTVDDSSGEFIAIGDNSGQVPYRDAYSLSRWPWYPISAH